MPRPRIPNKPALTAPPHPELPVDPLPEAELPALAESPVFAESPPVDSLASADSPALAESLSLVDSPGVTGSSFSVTVTVISLETSSSPIFAVIVAVPALRAVTTPSAETETTVLSETT